MPSIGRAKPAPNSASTTSPAPSSSAGVERLDRPRPARGGDARRRPSAPARVAEQRQPHRPAALGQNARRDKPVAAIVAGPAQHRDRPQRPAPRRPHRRPRGRHSPSASMPATPPAIVSRSASPISLRRQQRVPVASPSDGSLIRARCERRRLKRPRRDKRCRGADDFGAQLDAAAAIRYLQPRTAGVAQLVRAPDCGSGCRRFKSASLAPLFSLMGFSKGRRPTVSPCRRGRAGRRGAGRPPNPCRPSGNCRRP